MEKFKKNIVVKDWNEYGPGIAYVSTIKEILEMMENKTIDNAKTNRDPKASPWAKGSEYTFFRNLIFGVMRAKKAHKDFIGQANSMSVFIDNHNNIWIIDGGHRLMYLGNLNNPEFVFPPLYNAEIKDCTFLKNWVGKTVKDVIRNYPAEWDMLMSAPIMISTVDDDGVIQQGNNDGRKMSATEKAYALIKNHPTYIALEDAMSNPTSPIAKYHTINIGSNKCNNVRVRVNNMCWAVSILAHHRLEKSGAAMRYMVENYSADFIIESYKRLISAVNPSDFSAIVTQNKKTGFVYNCNAIHGIMEYARNKTIPTSPKKRNELIDSLGDNETTNPFHIKNRMAAANKTLNHLEEKSEGIKRKVVKVQKKYGESYVSTSSGGHVGSGRRLAKYLEEVK